MALLPLVEMGTAPPIAPGYDMLWPMSRFTRHHVELDNCSCPFAEHSRAMALIELSCACKRTASKLADFTQLIHTFVKVRHYQLYDYDCICHRQINY